MMHRQIEARSARYPLAPVARHVWATKYRWQPPGGSPESDVAQTWWRVAQALAGAEPSARGAWARRFYRALADFRFVPGGRILAGAGTRGDACLLNCFVMPDVADAADARFRALRESALTLQAGGGIGLDFSGLRPRGQAGGESAPGHEAFAAGPVAWMHVWDKLCATVETRGQRRGAMMAVLACDHPDIEAFVRAKRESGALSHFNLSVLVSDAFLAAVAAREPWPLRFPAGGQAAGRVVRTIPAATLWDGILRNAYETAEPGVLFIDRINRCNNLAYRERLHATNPCGEIPLPPYGACDLGSFNLTAFVVAPFTAQAAFDWPALRRLVPLAVRMLDNVYDISAFPLPVQQAVGQGARRLGLGLMGLGDALVMLGLRYDSTAGRKFAARAMGEICHGAYRASVALAAEKGACAAFSTEPYLQAPFIAALPQDIRDGIAASGIRNSHLTAIAPTGSISLLANNVSSGLEPIFAPSYERRLHGGETDRVMTLHSRAVLAYRELTGDARGVPPAFRSSSEVSATAQLQMQAALQRYVDNAIAKTVNLPAETGFEAFRATYDRAARLGLKGCTTYRPTALRQGILCVRPPHD
ncbi:adenosylcobalamin-dependent ribonucleoside-diphosphate reductase [Pandoraea sp.]|uniref:adenosylcobalamin-dependent ribonucleoside-diphosphate reductase n=1 Tax=Pandoraea sp. TaxID=1883445 RepID=UPI0025EBF39A|nr:adenosylcobalamin-dependent ribonucleoside-diphosphate reductase [Pandoraea sp.]